MTGSGDVVLYTVDYDCGLYSGHCGLLVFPGVEKDTRERKEVCCSY